VSLNLIISLLTFPGEFISNMDSTIVVANAGPISSEFNRLQDANWLSTAFSLGVGSVQLLVCILDQHSRKCEILTILY